MAFDIFGGREKPALFDSLFEVWSHLFIAAESLTALSVNTVDAANPVEVIKHAGWTLNSKESRM